MSLEDDLPFGLSETRRFVSSGAELALFKPMKVDSGEIEFVDYQGGDDLVERFATMGLGRSVFPESPSQREFMQYLVNHGIYEPFKAVQLKLSVQAPIDVALNMVYAPMCSVNEYSGRYSVMLNSSRQLKLSDLEGMPEDHAKKIIEMFNAGREGDYQKYLKLSGENGLDMTRELGRSILGIDNDTRFYWKIDLFSLANFVDKHAELFHQGSYKDDYLHALYDIGSKVAPLAWEALMGSDAEKINLTFPKDKEIVDSSLSPALWGVDKTKRVIVPALEERLYKIQNFLDCGEFQPVEYMGNDESFAQAARISYGKGTKTLQNDRALIRTLIRDAHTSPIEMAELAFETKSPMFVDPRQFARHRMLDTSGFMGLNTVGSQFYHIPESEFKYQDRTDRQGRGKEMDGEDLTQTKELLFSTLEDQKLRANQLDSLDAPEWVVRQSKGVGFYTKSWRSGDTHNLGHMIGLRADKHAQKEIRDLAYLVMDAMKSHTPIAVEAMQNYNWDAMKLSANEQKLFARLLKEKIDLEDFENYKGVGFIIGKDDEKKLGREGLAFKEKLKQLLG